MTMDDKLILKIREKLHNKEWLDKIVAAGRLKVTEDINETTHWLCLPDPRNDGSDHVTDFCLYQMYIDKFESEHIILDDTKTESLVYMWREGLYIRIEDEFESADLETRQTEYVIHLLCVADRANGFPNFYPIGAYTTRDIAVKELVDLPKNKHYQLFEIPINQFFGRIEEDGRLTNGLGWLRHEHFESEEESGSNKK